MAYKADPHSVAAELRKVLQAVEQGSLSAKAARDRRIAAQIEGAIVALEQIAADPPARPRRPKPVPPPEPD